jgi:hypothetical protein
MRGGRLHLIAKVVAITTTGMFDFVSVSFSLVSWSTGAIQGGFSGKTACDGRSKAGARRFAPLLATSFGRMMGESEWLAN